MRYPEAQLSRWRWLHACSVRLQDRIRRRVLEGETIPRQEKLFSLFEPHTRWIMKGKKAGQPVELGVPLTVLEDQYQVYPRLACAVAWRGRGRGGSAGGGMPGAVSGVARMQFLDRRFHSPTNQQQLAEMLEHVALPAKGRGTEASRALEEEAAFVARRRHPGVESAIHALECRGLDRVRTQGRDNGIRISGKGFWSLRMSCNRLIYGNIFDFFGILQKTLTFQHGLWQSTLR